MHLPTDEWMKHIKEHVEKSNKLIQHYEILCEEKKVREIVVVVVVLLMLLLLQLLRISLY